MLSTAERATVIPASPPSAPRLLLAPVRADQAVLDGAWWPRSRDPEAELPGLILALSNRYGRIRSVVVSNSVWDRRFRRLRIGAGLVRIGWFTSMDSTLLIATTDRGDQVDLLVVPPATTAAVAQRAMAYAADPGDNRRAPALLAAATAMVADRVDGAAQDAGRDGVDRPTRRSLPRQPPSGPAARSVGI